MTVLLWRGLLVLVMLLPASDFLGFLDPMAIAVAQAFDIYALLTIFIVAAIVAGLGRLPVLLRARFFAPLCVLLALWIYAVSAPIFRGESTFWLALGASKEFMMLLAYFPPLLFLRTHRDLGIAWWTLAGFGVYYCAVEIFAQLAGTSLLALMVYAVRPEIFGMWKVYMPFWPVILVLLFYAFFQYTQRQRGQLPWLLLGVAGLVLTFFRSYLLASMIVLPLLFLVCRTRHRSAAAGTEVAVAGTIVIMLVALLLGRGFAGAADAFVLSAIPEFTDNTGGALAGREAYSKMLWALVQERPALGYGFIDKDAASVAHLPITMFAGASLGFVDKGDADVAVRFGLLGAALLFAAFGVIALRALKIARRTEDRQLAARALTVAALIAVYCCVQPVHAPLTYGFGLLPLALAAGIVDKEAMLLEQDEAT